MKVLYHIGTTVCVLMSLIAIGLSTPTLSRDFALATSLQPEHYTELYFNSLLSLPPVIESAKPQSLRFTISNHEGVLTTYQYRVSIVENGGVKSVANKSVILSSEQSTSLPVTFSANKPHATIEIIVELPEKNQTIHFRSKS